MTAGQDSDGWSPLALGTATFGYGLYSPPPTTQDALEMPLRTVRLALKYGVTVIDTAAQSVAQLSPSTVVTAIARPSARAPMASVADPVVPSPLFALLIAATIHPR